MKWKIEQGICAVWLERGHRVEGGGALPPDRQLKEKDVSCSLGGDPRSRRALLPGWRKDEILGDLPSFQRRTCTARGLNSHLFWEAVFSGTV